MKTGVKTYNDETFLAHFENKCDFFEVQAIEKNNYKFLEKFNKRFVIHAQHKGFGINNADKTLHDKNLKSINFARKLADTTKAKKIIMHPGVIENENCSRETAIKFIKNIKDKRIIIENHSQSKTALCTTPEKMKEFLNKTGKGFCFDFNHAISVANQTKQDPINFIKRFMKLKPDHYHLCGQKITNILGIYKKDTDHLCLANSTIDIKKIVHLIPKNADVTLETEIDISKTEDDLAIIKKLTTKNKVYFKK